jgi:phenylalanyl-tRNA synthetase beta chain
VYEQRLGVALPFTPGMDERRRFNRQVMGIAVGLGYFEACTYPFESPRVAEKLNAPDDSLTLTIDNPLGEDFGVMRTTTLGGLLAALSLNYAKRNAEARLFEMAWEYKPKALPLTQLPDELPRLTFAAYGPEVDYLSMKGDIEELLDLCVGGRLVFEPAALPHMHPGRTATVACKYHSKRDALPLGYLGELHPAVCAGFDTEARIYVAVLDMDAIYTAFRSRRSEFVPPPRFPALVRDLAFTVGSEITAAQCEAAIRERGGPLLADVTLFDVYTGEQIEGGYKSMAYNLRFVAPDRTLTDEAAQKLLTTIRANLEQKLSARVR